MYNDDHFLDVMDNMVNGESYVVDGAYCNFPDFNGIDEKEHFEGVEFSVGSPPGDDGSIIATEELCYKFVCKACDKYLKLHPENIDIVKELMEKIPA